MKLIYIMRIGGVLNINFLNVYVSYYLFILFFFLVINVYE